jgi:proteasome lid subunit RPN8/RPN11
MMQPVFLQIPKRICDDMIAHARAELPNECVGMLVGTPDGQVKDSYPLINELQSPTRFLSEARSMLAAEKRRRDAGLELLAIYHSHPTSPPVPSKYDRADHLSTEILCVIISLTETEPVIKAWRLEDNASQPCDIVVE